MRPLRLDADHLSAEQKSGNAPFHTALWRAQVDYVLPSKQGLNPLEAKVFWPAPDTALWRLIESRQSSSDHRLVWIDLEITD